MLMTADKPYKATWSMPKHDRLGSNVSHIETFATSNEAYAAICKPFQHGYARATVQCLETVNGRKVWVRVWKRENGKAATRWR